VASVTQEYKTSQAPIVVGSSNWYKGSVVIKPVPGSGYTKIGVADGNGDVAVWLDSMVITTEAVDAVATFRLKDGAGVTSAVRQLTYSLDATKPTGTLTVGGVADEIDSLTYKLYSRDTLTFSVGGIADVSSGIAKAQLFVCNTIGASTWCNAPMTCSNGDVFKVAPTHSGYVGLVLTDVVGNRDTILSKHYLTMLDATVDTSAIQVNLDSLPAAGEILIPTSVNGLALQRLMLGQVTFAATDYFASNGQVHLYPALLSALPAGQDTIVFVFASPSTPNAPDKYLSKPYLVVNVIGSANSSSSSSSSSSSNESSSSAESSSSSASSVLAANDVAGALHISAAPFGVLVESDRSMAIEVRNLRGELMASIELHQGLNPIRLKRGVYIIGKQRFSVMQ